MLTKSFLLFHSILLFHVILGGSEGFSQNVGIGTTTPAGKLQINHRSSTIHPGILLQDSTTGYSGLLRFKNVASAKYMQLWGYYDGSSSAGQFLDISSDSTFVATFRGNGNLGIGVLTPTYRLDVNGVINSTTEYRLAGKTILRWDDLTLGLYRTFSAGDSAGFSNTTGIHNTFIGGGAGVSNISGSLNCFVGTKAGYNNISGSSNTFIGSEAGRRSTSASNTFVGSHAGFNNENGYNNVFIGTSAGFSNTSGHQNTFIGLAAGDVNQSGVDNIFIGLSAGDANTTGSFNTVIGNFSNLGSTSLINASAIGFRAYVTQSNSLVLGCINGVNGSGFDTKVGIGTTAPTERLDIVGNLKVSGELNHPSTGTSNLLPIAFGSISSAGGINSSSENFTVTRTAAGSYTIDITNHSYTLSTYATVVTVAGSTPLVAITSSGSGNLTVRLYNLSGVLTDGTFHFVVHKQ